MVAPTQPPTPTPAATITTTAAARELSLLEEELRSMLWYRAATQKTLTALFNLVPPTSYEAALDRTQERIEKMINRLRAAAK